MAAPVLACLTRCLVAEKNPVLKGNSIVGVFPVGVDGIPYGIYVFLALVDDMEI